ncbi:unnamed protein product [Enterobius vermicularis]|uniref:Uncharacterized protein n=1 Tax=Enterobius vermicularis TaxID=51028 RepID=A0A0N4UYQ6_ENTVE|nr:unnamed protein product [Enterobius vermicularis]
MISHKREVSFSDQPSSYFRESQPKQLSIDTNNDHLSVPGPAQAYQERSPGSNLNILVPKRQYSIRRKDSLRQMPTPVFDKVFHGYFFQYSNVERYAQMLRY